MAVAAGATLTGCTKEMSTGGSEKLEQMSFIASNDSRTTLLSDDSVVWNAGDAISIFDGSANRQFTTSESGASCMFTGEASQAETYVAMYPYNADASYKDGKILTVIPRTQKAVKGSFGSGANVSIASFSGNSFSMKNIGGLIEFTITSSEYSSIELRGNNNERLAGKSYLSFDTVTGDPVVENYGKAEQYGSIEIVPDGADVLEAGTYYVAVLPVTFNKGLKFTFTRKSDGKCAEVSVTDKIEVGRAAISGMGTIDSGKLNWDLALHISILDHPTAGTINWPFVVDEDHPKPINTGADDGKWKETRTPLKTLDGGYDFYIYGGTNVRLISTNGQGLKFGSTADDYLEFPVIAGYGLSKVVITSGNYNGTNSVTLHIEKVSDSSTVGDSWTNQTVGASHTWVIDDEEGAAYRLKHAAGQNCSIERMDVYYSQLGTMEVKTVTTGAASGQISKEGTTATLNGSFTASGFIASAFACGFRYRTSEGAEWTEVTCAGAALSFSYDLSGLVKNTKYVCQAWAKANGGEKVYGEEVEFKPSDTYMATIDMNQALVVTSWGLGKNTLTAVDPATAYKVTVDGIEYELHLYSAVGMCYRTSGVNDGLNLSKADKGNSWIKIPAREGYKLVNVKIQVDFSTEVQYNVSSAVDNSGKGDAAQCEMTKAVKWNLTTLPLSSPAVNTPYYLCCESTDASISTLYLSYRIAE